MFKTCCRYLYLTAIHQELVEALFLSSSFKLHILFLCIDTICKVKDYFEKSSQF